MAKLQQGVNDLYTWCLNNGSLGKQLIDEWVGLDENNEPIFMDNVAMTSTKKVKWKCSKGHVWIAAIFNRTRNGSGCILCYKEELVKSRSLKTWSLSNGARGKQLLKELIWLDENDQPLAIDNVSYTSRKKVKWKCEEGHIWVAPIVYRTTEEKDCPYCKRKLEYLKREEEIAAREKKNTKAKKKLSVKKHLIVKNNLRDWCSSHGALGRQLRAEWMGFDGYNIPISMSEVGVSSKRQVMWKCRLGHVWLATIRDRTIDRTECPHCSNVKQQGGK